MDYFLAIADFPFTTGGADLVCRQHVFLCVFIQIINLGNLKMNVWLLRVFALSLPDQNEEEGTEIRN